MRHVGKIANTDQKCVVVFMQIPNSEEHALVIPTDNLPLRMEQAVMDRLNSTEGQQTENFYEVLNRYRMPDTGETILLALHNQNKLQKVPVHNVLMLPEPNRPVNLSFILEHWPTGNRLKGKTDTHMLNNWEPEKYNPYVANQTANASENQKLLARNIMIEAEMLEADARKKREMAYSYDPSLRDMHEQKASAPVKRFVPEVGTKTETLSDYFNPVSIPVVQKTELPSMYGDSNEVTTPVAKQPNEMEERMARLEGMLTSFMDRMAPAEEVKAEQPKKAKKVPLSETVAETVNEAE